MKKVYSCIFIAFLFFCFETKSQILSQQEAKNIVLQLYSDTIYDNYQIYQRNNIMYEDEVLMTLFDTVVNIEDDSYVFFVDEVPYNSWGHSCKYVLINTSDTSITTYSNTMPPDLGIYEIIKETSIEIPTGLIIPNFEKFGSSSKHCENNDSQYAVIINGGINKYTNYQRYWNDCSFIYTTLVNTYGYKKSNIYVLMSDGQNSGVDQILPNNSFVSSPLDLDGDGVCDIQYSATKSNISIVFDSLAAKMTADDNLFIFTIDHGGYNSETQESFLCLWNNEIITAREFGMELLKLNQNTVINTVMGQCNAGGFSGWFDNGVNRVSSFASTYDKASHPLEGGKYDAFVYFFISAINGFTPFGQIVNADADNNGEISMYEAFSYARTMAVGDYPIQTTSNSWLPNVLTMCNKSQFDLVILDSPEDKGEEPNNNSEYMYVSDDIYVRLQPDGYSNYEHQNPISGQRAYVYVKVRNNSYKSYSNDEEEGSVKLFWAKAGLGLSWPQPWQGGDSINGIVLGGQIGYLPVIDPDLDYYNGYIAGSDKIYSFEWQVPDLEDYADLPENWHFCLLAVLDSEADTISDNDCNGDLERFVRNNNNIAWKNISIINRDNNNIPTYVSVNNWSNERLNTNLLFTSHKDEQSPFLHDVADITITLNKPLYELFLENWSSAYGMEVCIDKDNSFLIKKDSANIDLLLLPHKLYLLGLDIDFLLDKGNEKKQYRYDISLRNKSKNNAVIGGEQYLIEKWETEDNLYVDAGDDQVIHIGEYATLNAANAGMDVFYKWIDKKNDTVINAQTFEVNPIETQQYILKVETDNGFIGYDSTNVVVKSEFIESISPHPVSDVATVMYEASQANNASLEIINNIGIIVANYTIDPSLNQYMLNCSALASGQYTLILNCDGKRKDATILIIE